MPFPLSRKEFYAERGVYLVDRDEGFPVLVVKPLPGGTVLMSAPVLDCGVETINIDIPGGSELVVRGSLADIAEALGLPAPPEVE